MSHELVRILTADNGEPKHDADVWHWPTFVDAPRTLCEGEAFGLGESGCEVETKVVKRGGITCPKCLAAIREFKAIKL